MIDSLTARCPGAVAVKQTQIINPPTTVLDSWCDCTDINVNIWRVACRVWALALAFHGLTVWIYWETSGEIASCFKLILNFTFLIKTVEWWIWNSLEITLWRVMSTKSYLSKITAVFPHQYCLNTRLNAPDLQTVKTSAFIEVLPLADDQIIKYILLAAPGWCLPF